MANSGQYIVVYRNISYLKTFDKHGKDMAKTWQRHGKYMAEKPCLCHVFAISFAMLLQRLNIAKTWQTAVSI